MERRAKAAEAKLAGLEDEALCLELSILACYPEDKLGKVKGHLTVTVTPEVSEAARQRYASWSQAMEAGSWPPTQPLSWQEMLGAFSGSSTSASPASTLAGSDSDTETLDGSFVSAVDYFAAPEPVEPPGLDTPPESDDAYTTDSEPAHVEPTGPGAHAGRDEPTGPGIIPPTPDIPLRERCLVSRMCRRSPGESLAEHVLERHLPAWWRRSTYCATCRTRFRTTGGWKRHRAQCRWPKFIPTTLWARRVVHVVEAVGSHLQVRSGYDGLLEITREVEQELEIDWPILGEMDWAAIPLFEFAFGPSAVSLPSQRPEHARSRFVCLLPTWQSMALLLLEILEVLCLIYFVPPGLEVFCAPWARCISFDFIFLSFYISVPLWI